MQLFHFMTANKLWRILALICVLPTAYTSAQQRFIEKNFTFKERLALKTNAVDWLLMTPNVGIEFDLNPSEQNKYTLSLSGKYNWDTSASSTYTPYMVYNISEVRLEARRYYRTQQIQVAGAKDNKQSPIGHAAEKGLEGIQHLFAVKSKGFPKFWRAYYAGIFVNSLKYTYKYSRYGYQGEGFGAGVSWGMGMPLYQLSNGSAIDLEIGASIGAAHIKYDKFIRNREADAYEVVDSKASHWTMLAPGVSELRVAFVYRFASISKKYKTIHR